MNATRTARTALVGLLAAGVAVLLGVSTAPAAHSAGSLRAERAAAAAPVNPAPVETGEDVTWGQ
ncbi:hypothetical protein [Kitasatospora cheerisanensis]|uniref:Uncharacterized protein n=1 Tax=Kitasatospora cheerisanensis KCTC 2395 TaxID=1348663 RepID=A0A066YP50_9ACTN|nr:hypothetical protein [Kitasatospora cheerisanensis]KDN81744.1 hypothetical protein KCH_64640 [Kitasatospora cheerisanensis KCTC 2395]